MSAQFSALYEHSSGLVQWSPNGRYVAMAAGRRLIIRDSNGFEIIKVRVQSVCPCSTHGCWGC